jgi:hypothetical protein
MSGSSEPKYPFFDEKQRKAGMGCSMLLSQFEIQGTWMMAPGLRTVMLSLHQAYLSCTHTS